MIKLKIRRGDNFSVMDYLAQLNLIASNWGSFNANTLRKLNTLHQKILNQIQKDANKNIVPSTFNIDDLIELSYKGDLPEGYINQIKQYLLDQGLIYKDGDLLSYIKNVRSKGKMSLTESNARQNKRMNPGFNMIMMDTEFPIDQQTGQYIINMLPFEQVEALIQSGQVKNYELIPTLQTGIYIIALHDLNNNIQFAYVIYEPSSQQIFKV